jgi:hypothetical protein
MAAFPLLQLYLAIQSLGEKWRLVSGKSLINIRTRRRREMVVENIYGDNLADKIITHVAYNTSAWDTDVLYGFLLGVESSSSLVTPLILHGRRVKFKGRGTPKSLAWWWAGAGVKMHFECRFFNKFPRHPGVTKN